MNQKRNLTLTSNSRHEHLPTYCKETWKASCPRCKTEEDGVCIREAGEPRKRPYLFFYHPEKVFADFISKHGKNKCGCDPVYMIVSQVHITPDAVLGPPVSQGGQA